jgi:hypothetical protein
VTAPDPSELADLVQLGCFAADVKVVQALDATGAEQTRIAVEAALYALIAQGYLAVTDPEMWPEYFSPNGDSGPFPPTSVDAS